MKIFEQYLKRPGNQKNETGNYNEVRTRPPTQVRLSRKETFEIQRAVFSSKRTQESLSSQIFRERVDPNNNTEVRKILAHDISRNESKERRLSRKESYLIQEVLCQDNEIPLIVLDDNHKGQDVSKETSPNDEARVKRSLLTVIVSRSSNKDLASLSSDSSASPSRNSSPTSKGLSGLRSGIASTNFFRAISATICDRSPSPMSRSLSESPSDRSDFEDISMAMTSFQPRPIPKLFSRFRKPRALKDADGILHYAASQNNTSLVARILEENKDLDVNCPVSPGVTALHQACVFGNEEIVRLLIRSGANVNLKTWSKLSPLQLAASFGHFDVAAILIENGADRTDIQDGIVSMEMT